MLEENAIVCQFLGPYMTGITALSVGGYLLYLMFQIENHEFYSVLKLSSKYNGSAPSRGVLVALIVANMFW